MLKIDINIKRVFMPRRLVIGIPNKWHFCNPI